MTDRDEGRWRQEWYDSLAQYYLEQDERHLAACERDDEWVLKPPGHLVTRQRDAIDRLARHKGVLFDLYKVLKPILADAVRAGAAHERERAAFEVKELINMVLILEWPVSQQRLNEVQSAAKRAAAIREGEDG